MRKFLLSLLAIGFLYFNAFNTNAQQLNFAFGKDLKWRMGFNHGMHYQSSDVRSRNGIGLGATLERKLAWGDGPFGLSLRGQYFWGNSYGRDVDPFNIQNNSDLNGDRLLDYTSLGYVYHNYSTDIHELSLEALFYLCRPVKKPTGFLLYLYGGIGAGGHKTRMDQANDFSGQEYDYSQVGGSFNFSIKNDLESLRDGKYETFADNHELRQWFFTPSIGLGWGFQISPRVSFAFEHKLNFTPTDILDGNKYKQNGELDNTNDKYHYTSMMWGVGLGKGGSGTVNTNSNTRTTSTTPLPIVKIINPSVSPITSDDCQAYIMAKIYNISGIENIRVTKNGVNVPTANYTFNSDTRVFELNQTMDNGGSYIIQGFNSAGKDEKSVVFNCPAKTTNPIETPATSPPTVVITFPTEEVYNAPSCTSTITARLTGVTDKKNVSIHVNGREIGRSRFDYTESSGFLKFNTTIDKTAEIMIGAVNNDGSAFDKVIINCTPPQRVVAPPTVTIESPSINPSNSENCKVYLKARIRNITDPNGVTVVRNGITVGNTFYTFNTSSGILTIQEPVENSNTYSITATNSAGSATDQRTINCTPPAPVPPTVTFINPSFSPTVTNDCNYNVVARTNNITNKDQIRITTNGNPLGQYDFDFDQSTGTISFTKNILVGLSKIVISVQNDAGVDEAKTVITCKPSVLNKPKPTITILSPSSNPQTTTNCNINLRAQIGNVKNKFAITVKVGIRTLLMKDYNYDESSGILTLNRPFQNEATVKITARNSMGSVSKTHRFICQSTQPQPVKPKVNITTPNTSPFYSENCNIVVRASTSGITNKNQITIKENNSNLFSNSWSFNTTTGQIEINKRILCATTFTITVRNNNGSATDNVQVDCNYGRGIPKPPVVTIKTPSGNPHNTTTCNTNVIATITEINSKYDIRIERDGRPLSSSKYNYNSSTKTLSFNESESGSHTFVIKATNNDGSDSKSLTINCTPRTVVKPTVVITKPSSSPFYTEDCNIVVIAKTTGITNANQITIKENNFTLFPSSWTFNSGTNTITITKRILCATKFTITVSNNNGSATTQTEVDCNYGRALPKPPVVTITSPTNNPYTTTTCNTNVVATVTEINSKYDIKILRDGRPLSSSKYSYNSSNNQLTFNESQSGSHTFKITATNNTGSDSKSITITCTPPEKKITICHYPPGNTSNPQEIEIPESAWPSHQAHGDKLGSCPTVPVIQKPSINITSPTQSSVTVENCKINVTAMTKEITNSSQISVTLNGAPVRFSFEKNSIRIANESFNGTGNIKITVTNQAGSASDNVSFTCKPPEKKITICHYPPGNRNNPQELEIPVSAWPSHQAHGDKQGSCPQIITTKKPTITITNPTQSTVVVENCKIDLTAKTTEVMNKSQVKVTQGGNPINFTFDDGTIRVSNINFTGTSPILITVTNNAGSATDNVTFTCKPPEKKIDICLNGKNQQINESQWPSYQSQGATKGSCPIIVKPRVIISNPTEQSITVENCKINVKARAVEISEKSQVSVTQNGKAIDFTFNNGYITISNIDFSNTANILIKVTNSAGSATDNVTFTCKPPEKKIDICLNGKNQQINESQWPSYQSQGATKGSCPIIVKPRVIISNPTEQSVTVESCKINVTARAVEISEKSQISVTQNGKAIDFTFNNGYITISNVDFSNTANILIKVTNSAGSATDNVTFTCKPPEKKITICHYPPGNKNNPQEIEISENAWPAHLSHGDTKGKCPVIQKPTVTITSPTQTSVTVENCKINVTARATNVTEKSQISVTQSGRALNFTYNNGIIAIANVDFSNTANIQVKVTNSAGSATDNVTFTCKPPEKKITICHYPPGNRNNPQEIEISENAWPAHLSHGDTKGKCPVIQKPTVTITSPTQTSVTVENCKINVTARATNVTEKSQISVTQSGRALNFTFNNGIIAIANVDFSNTANIQVKVTNSAGSATDNVTFICKPPEKKITICHYPPGNRNNPQEIEISENAWPAHLKHGDTKGKCPVIQKPTVTITSPTQTSVTVENCRINVTARATNVTEKSQISVTQSGRALNFTFNNGIITIANVDFSGTASIQIKVTNSAGSATDNVTFTCKPKPFDFQIKSGSVTPNKKYNANVKVLGCALKVGGTGADYPVMVQVKFGSSTKDPFGRYSGYNVSSNVNDHKQHNWNSNTAIAANTPITVKAKSYSPNNTSKVAYEYNSATDSRFVKVLRNGDPAPNVAGFKGQQDAETYLKNYIQNGKIKLQANQAIYLFELGTNQTNVKWYDLQDCVVLVTLTPVN